VGGSGSRIELGRVVGVFGTRGELRVYLHNPVDSVLERSTEVILRDPSGRESATTMIVRPGAGRRILGRVQGVDTPEQARALMGTVILVERSALPAPPPGEFYVTDLIGLHVVDSAGADLGRLSEVIEGPVDAWVIDRGPGRAEAWVMAEAKNIVAVELAAGRVVVRAGALAEAV
jgi:16S rRNA processing protein RimM